MKSTKPVIQIRTGSDSDLPKIRETFKILKSTHTPFEVRILSAHRTPDAMSSEAKKLAKRGIKLCLAAAGGSAHLPGMTASETNTPVIGIPVVSNFFKGLDSILSILQMPEGIPVGCVNIGDARAAAVFAASVTRVSDNSKTTEILFGSQTVRHAIQPALSLARRLGLKLTPPSTKSNNAPTILVFSLNNRSELKKIAKFIQSSSRNLILCPLAKDVSRAAALKNLDEIGKLLGLPRPKGSLAASVCTGISRPKNAILFAAQIKALTDRTLQSKLTKFRKSLAQEVASKDAKIREGQTPTQQ